MADEVESIRLKNKEKLPEELAEFDYYRKGEQGQWEGVYEDGRSKKVTHLGELLAKALLKFDAAEEETDLPADSLENLTPEVRTIMEQHDVRFQKLEDKIKGLDDRLGGQQTQLDEMANNIRVIIGALDAHGYNTAEIRRQMQAGRKPTRIETSADKAKDADSPGPVQNGPEAVEPPEPSMEERIQILTADKEQVENRLRELEAQLGITAPAEPAGIAAEDEITEVRGFKQGDTVSRRVGGNVTPGFEVRYFVKENGEDRIVAKDPNTGELVVIPPDQIVNETTADTTVAAAAEPAPPEAVTTTASQPPVRRRRNNFFTRTWFGFMNVPRTVEYIEYDNETGRPYYIGANDEQVWVEERRSNAGIAAAAATVAALFSAGTFLYEIFENDGGKTKVEVERIQGGGGVEKRVVVGGKTIVLNGLDAKTVRQIIKSDRQKILAAEKAHDDNLAASLNRKLQNRLTKIKKNLDKELRHDHGHEMLAIHGNEFTNGKPNSYFHPNQNK